VNERRIVSIAAVTLAAVLGVALGQEPLGQAPDAVSARALPVDYSRFAVDDEDAQRLRGLSFRLADWEQAANYTTEQGLRLRAMFVPDALAYKVATLYLELRENGADHDKAIEELARSFPRWRRYQSQSSVVVDLVNEKFRLSPRDRRIYTLQKALDKGGVVVRAGKRRMKAVLAGKPAGLRFADLRIKKFWTTQDGATRRARSKNDPDRSPTSTGKVAKIGKPFPSFVLEGNPVEIELLISRATIQKRGYDGFRVDLNHWKRYEGPFAKDLLDLNDKRPWDPLRDVHVYVSTPPLGFVVGPELKKLVALVRARTEDVDR